MIVALFEVLTIVGILSVPVIVVRAVWQAVQPAPVPVRRGCDHRGHGRERVPSSRVFCTGCGAEV